MILRLAIFTAAPLLIALPGCDSTPNEVDAGAEGGSGGAGGAEDAPDMFSLPPVGGGDAEVAAPLKFVVIRDLTEGVGFNEWYGADVDAMIWTCPDGSSGYAVAANALQTNGTDQFPLELALGAPDGPCTPPSGCATPVGPAGWIALDPGVEDLAGCSVEIREIADGSQERYSVMACPTDELTLDCEGPLAEGVDGETLTVDL